MMQCEHIHGNGARCLSPVLHRRSFCYMHRRQREHKLAVPPEPEFQLPTIDSEASAVLASNQIASAVLAGKLDPKRARIVLACMKMALDSLRRMEDVSEITECDLTPAMHKELVGTADAAKDEAVTPPTDLPDMSLRGGRPSDDESASSAPSHAALTPFQQSAQDLLADLTSSAPATIEDLERVLDRHPSFTGVTS